MVGRCGRGGDPGLALLFVEPIRQNGKNSVEDFHNIEFQPGDNRMDALAVTPVCLRVAFSLDNLCVYGHILNMRSGCLFMLGLGKFGLQTLEE